MRGTPSTATILSAALLLAACAAGSSPSTTPRPSVPPGFEEIASQYLELVAASNAATCAFNATLSQPAPALADLKRASADYADSLATLQTGLRGLDWPAGLAADADALISALGTNFEHTRDMAGAATLQDFIGADNQLIQSNKASAAAASALRQHLGLAAAGNPCAT